MIFQRLRETLFFFWQHLTELLWHLAPVLPLLAISNYRLVEVHGGDPRVALGDPLTLLPELFAGVMATALAIRYTVAKARQEAVPFGVLWRGALADTLPLAVLQILVGLLILGGLLLLILPGIFLAGVLLPSYVILVQEQRGPLAAIRAAWDRYLGRAWSVSANVLAVFLLLMVVLNGLTALGQLLGDAPLEARLAAMSLLDLVGVLFAQLVAILLVRFYEIEQAPSPKAGWN